VGGDKGVREREALSRGEGREGSFEVDFIEGKHKFVFISFAFVCVLTVLIIN
jgi:hypothetical protein